MKFNHRLISILSSKTDNIDNKMKITENIKTEIIAHYDVAVCGGGIAGISAALAAARRGASVLLVETSYILGGLATSGLVTEYLPLCNFLTIYICYLIIVT